MDITTLENKGGIKIINLRGKKNPQYDIYIGRRNDQRGLPGSRWANPIVLKSEADRESVLERHMKYMRNYPELLLELPDLKGKTLACWCCDYDKETGYHGKLCHGLNLIKLYDELVP